MAIITTLLALTSPTYGSFIDFTSMAADIPVSNQFQNVVFSLSGGNNPFGAPTTSMLYQGTQWGGLTNTNSGGIYPTAEFLVATFEAPVTGVQFSFWDGGYNGGNVFRVYDVHQNLIDIGSLAPSGYVSAEYDLTSLQGVSSIWWDNGYPANTSGNWTEFLQTLSFTPMTAPEPSAFALLAAGLLGLVIRSRRAYSGPCSKSNL